MAIDTHWFQQRLAAKRLSQRRLAKLLDLDAAAVSLMFRGKRRMQMTEAADIARLLGLSLDEVIRHAGIRPPANEAELPDLSIPLVYWMDGHGEMHVLPPGERVTMTAALPDDAIACQCRTAMSAMEHMDRWILVFSAPTAGGVQPEAIGRYSVVRMAGGMMTVGYLRPGYSAGKYSIHRGGSVTEAQIEWAAPVALIQP